MSRRALSACGAVALAFGAAVACEPQKIELFEPVSSGDSVRDAGAGGSTSASGGTGAGGSTSAGGSTGTGGSTQSPPPTLQPNCGDAATCTGATPQCDPDNGRCVACVRDEHCGGETRRCARTIGRCVECLSDDDCTDDPDKPICKLSELECDDDPN